MATDLAMDPEYQLFVSSKCYEAAYELLISEALNGHTTDELSQVLKRLGNIRNEMGVFYMNQAAAMQTEKEGVFSPFFYVCVCICYLFHTLRMSYLVSVIKKKCFPSSFSEKVGVHSRAGAVEKEFCLLRERNEGL